MPDALSGTIPRACLSRWRHETDGEYTGAELSAIAREKLELIHRFAEDVRAQRVFNAYGRLVHTLHEVFMRSKESRRALREAEERIVEAVSRCGDRLPEHKAIKIFGISRSTYQHWLQEVKARCDRSTLLLCRRRYPFQLLAHEVRCMQRLLTDPGLAQWPVRTIAPHAARHSRVHASLNTWYRYRKLLGIARPSTPRAARKVGVRATTPYRI